MVGQWFHDAQENRQRGDLVNLGGYGRAFCRVTLAGRVTRLTAATPSKRRAVCAMVAGSMYLIGVGLVAGVFMAPGRHSLPGQMADTPGTLNPGRNSGILGTVY